MIAAALVVAAVVVVDVGDDVAELDELAPGRELTREAEEVGAVVVAHSPSAPRPAAGGRQQQLRLGRLLLAVVRRWFRRSRS